MTMVSEWSPALRFALLLAALHCWADQAMTEPVMAPTWSSWSSFSECTATCGSGVSYRARACTAPKGGEAECVGPAHEHKECSTTVYPPCELGWQQAGANCYRFQDDLDFSTSLEVCRALGGTLPQPTTLDQSLLVTDVIAGHLDAYHYWMGLVKRNGTWQWVDGGEATYTRWAPDGHMGGDCVQSASIPDLENHGKWTQTPCDWKWHTVCERPVLCEASPPAA